MAIEHFFIAGAQRSGTTYLYRLCAEHPQVEMAHPVKPEPKFFITDVLFEKGIDYYETNFFFGKSETKIRGEKSTSYIEIETAANRISRFLPSSKIVFILRDPLERAVSNYWFSVKNGFESLSIEQAFMREEERLQNYDKTKVSVSPYAYLRRGRYIDYIEMYEKYFRAGQIYILLYEDLINSVQPLRDLYAFLGVDVNYEPKSLNTIINANEEKPDKVLDPSLRRYLREYFEECNFRLSEKLGRPLTNWQ
ncbi:MAG: sulfotransferase [Chloroflexi bacterium]|nr:sulfotransferase [Chloroflexota bacterium]